jgi:hypothetical protein
MSCICGGDHAAPDNSSMDLIIPHYRLIVAHETSLVLVGDHAAPANSSMDLIIPLYRLRVDHETMLLTF